MRKTIEIIEVEKTELQVRIAEDEKTIAVLLKKKKAPARVDKELDRAKNSVIKCETELKATIAAVARADKLLHDLTNSAPLFAARTGKGNKPVSEVPFYTVEQYQADIEDADNPADVIVRNKKSEPIPVYWVDPPKPLAQEVLPDLSKGVWEPEKQYAKRKKYSVKTLKKYRETGSGAVRLTEDGMYLRDSEGNILRKMGDKQNSPYEYFVEHPK